MRVTDEAQLAETSSSGLENLTLQLFFVLNMFIAHKGHSFLELI